MSISNPTRHLFGGALLLIALLLLLLAALARPAGAQADAPELLYSSFFGASSTDWGLDIATDAQNNIYLVGRTYSNNLPAKLNERRGDEDGFVAKISADGQSVLWSRYLGGTNWFSEEATQVAVDPQGRIWVAGFTSSADFPLVNPFQAEHGTERDVFVTVLDANGTILYSSFLGGDWGDEVYDLTIDADGYAYLAGDMSAHYLARITPDFELDFWLSLEELPALAANAVAVDGAGNIYVAGAVDDERFPTVNATQAACGRYDESSCSKDAYILKLDPAGDTILYSSYLGGSAANGFTGEDVAQGIAVDGQGNIYLAGNTFSDDFPTRNAYQATKKGDTNFQELFVTKLSPNGASYAIAYSTFLGGEYWDQLEGMALGGDGSVYVTGLTSSPDFPTQAPAQESIGNGICNLGGNERYCYDPFVAMLSSGGSLTFSTFWGGSLDDSGSGLHVDGEYVYLSGHTESFNFPATTNAVQPDKALQDDAFVAVFGPAAAEEPTATPTATRRPGDPTPTATRRPGDPTPTATATRQPGDDPTPIPAGTRLALPAIMR